MDIRYRKGKVFHFSFAGSEFADSICFFQQIAVNVDVPTGEIPNLAERMNRMREKRK